MQADLVWPCAPPDPDVQMCVLMFLPVLVSSWRAFSSLQPYHNSPKHQSPVITFNGMHIALLDHFLLLLFCELASFCLKVLIKTTFVTFLWLLFVPYTYSLCHFEWKKKRFNFVCVALEVLLWHIQCTPVSSVAAVCALAVLIVTWISLNKSLVYFTGE